MSPAGTTAPSARSSRSAAADKILAAAAECVIRSGVANTSMQDVAAAADVSKGLIHYHFRDKVQLLATLVDWLAARVVGRQRAASGHVRAENAVDMVWSWAEGELSRGDLRALVALSLEESAEVRTATRAALERRRTAATEMVAAVYAALELTPRVPAALLAEVLVSFLDGLASCSAVAEPGEQRVAFDAFWLALLTLGD
jgi:TetR/AcrR family transcriptional regulator, transcriptional repressor for nem operon